MKRRHLKTNVAIGLVCCGFVLVLKSWLGEIIALSVGLTLILLPMFKLLAQQDELRQEVGQLRKVVKINEYRAYHDALTKLKNRYYFETAAKELDIPAFYPLSVIVADVDNLKAVNDRRGHLAGDQLLVEVAQLLRSCCRQDDVIVRWGGDEFVVLLPRTDEEGCAAVQARIKKACSEYKVDGFPVSLSLGAATKRSTQETLLDVLQRADQVLYQEKQKHIDSNSVDMKKAGS